MFYHPLSQVLFHPYLHGAWLFVVVVVVLVVVVLLVLFLFLLCGLFLSLSPLPLRLLLFLLSFFCPWWFLIALWAGPAELI